MFKKKKKPQEDFEEEEEEESDDSEDTEDESEQEDEAEVQNRKYKPLPKGGQEMQQPETQQAPEAMSVQEIFDSAKKHFERGLQLLDLISK